MRLRSLLYPGFVIVIFQFCSSSTSRFSTGTSGFAETGAELKKKNKARPGLEKAIKRAGWISTNGPPFARHVGPWTHKPSPYPISPAYPWLLAWLVPHLLSTPRRLPTSTTTTTDDEVIPLSLSLSNLLGKIWFHPCGPRISSGPEFPRNRGARTEGEGVLWLG